MKRKYQKPVQLNLSDLASAKGSCSEGMSFQFELGTDADRPGCSVGPSYGNESCGPLGISASNCSALGASAGP
jgi:hypothetical protein